MQTNVTNIAANSYPSLCTYSTRCYFLGKHKKGSYEKSKSVANGSALLAEYGFVLIHYKQKQHLKRVKQNKNKFKALMHHKQSNRAMV